MPPPHTCGLLTALTYISSQIGVQMVLFHLQIELRARHRWLHRYDADLCWLQSGVQSSAHRMDGCGPHVFVLWRLLRCVGPRFVGDLCG